MKRLLPLLALILLPLAVSGQPMERQGAVTFSNIAPGELENDIIKAMPVKIVFASETGKPYGGAFVRIFNEAGVAIFKHLCEKPWLFVKIPEGEYNVIAVDRKKITRIKPFTVGKEGSKQTVVKLTWPKEVVGY